MARPEKNYVQPSFEGYPTLHDLLDRETARYPERPYFLYTEDDKPDEIVRISMLELNRASHRAATEFSKMEGYDAQAREKVAFIAVSDTLVYTAAFYGTVRAGLVPFFMSPRLPIAAVVEVIQRSGCTRILTTPTLNALTDKVISDIQAANPGSPQIRRDFIPDLDVLFPHLGKETKEHEFQAFDQQIKEAEPEDTYFFMHSSGSTGIPKVVPQNRRAVAGWADRVYYKHWASLTPSVCLAVMPLPVFHALGILSLIVGPITSDAVMVIYPPTVKTPQSMPYTPSPSSVIAHAKRAGCNQILTPPSLIHEWAQNPEHVEFLKKMNSVLYAGGPIVPKIGDRLVEQGVSIVCIYGSTEAGVVSTLEVVCHRVPNSWPYMRIASNIKRRWIDQRDGTSELYFLRTKDQTPSILNLEGEEGYATSDLLEPHPTEPDLWKPVGRIDSVLVLATSEKVVPEPLEAIIGAHPSVLGIVVFGRARTSVGALIEPRPGHLKDYSPESIAEFRENLWPLVQQANDQAPAYARIFKEMIILANPDKPLPRTAKATVMAKAAFKVYEEEIEALYEGINPTHSGSTSAKTSGVRDLADKKEVEKWLLAESKDLLSKEIEPDTDLFYQGFDSLHASFLRNRVVQVLSSSAHGSASKALPLDVVYENPTVRKLAAAISALVAQPESTKQIDGVEAIRQAIDKYSQGLSPRVPSKTPTAASGPLTVLLTGSTGNLGAHLLAYLLEDPRVAKVYAHNRASTGTKSIVERQKASLAEHGLRHDLLQSEKLVLIEGDLAASQMGLPASVYDHLLNEINVVVHNAWKSNFNLTLQSFAPFMTGSRNLIDFSLASKNASDLRFVFTSTVASLKSWKEPTPVPEESLSDPAVAVGGGYGESKYVVERVLQQSGLNSSTFRITQLYGGRETGRWASDEWVPAILRTGLRLGSLPSSEGLVSWVSLPDTARVILDDALGETYGGANVYNLEHPRSVPWDAVVRHLNEAVVHQGIIGSLLPLVPFNEWIAKLEKIAAAEVDAGTLQEMPALKIIPFLRGVAAKSNQQEPRLGDQPAFKIDKILERSESMSKMKPLEKEDAVQWVKYWAGIGFLKPITA